MTLLSDKRVSPFLWLCTAAVVAFLGFWYPETVARQNATPDDRFGFALLIGLPFVLLAAIIACTAFYRLLRSAVAEPSWRSQAFMLLGAGLLIFVLIPIAILGGRML
jgi:hypothetical protein